MSTNTTASQHQCAHCPRAFSKPAHLLRHTRSHVSDRPFTCSLCHKSFTRTDTLQRHERTVHSTKRLRTDGSPMLDGDDSESRPGSSLPDAAPSPNNGWYSEQPEQAAPCDFTFSIPDPGCVQPALIPSSAAEVNTLIAEWLAQDGGLGLESLFPASHTGTACSNETAFLQQPPGDASCGMLSPRPKRSSNRGRRRTVVAADTWESGITPCPQDAISRAQSPQQSLTSPEQVVGKLNVNGPHVSRLSGMH